MEVLTEILIATLLAVLYWFYRYLIKNYDFWEKLHVVGPKPTLFFGNYKDVVLNKIHIADKGKEIYDSYPNEPAIGVYEGRKPVLMLKDPEMLKDVLIKSFPTFADRGYNVHEFVDPLTQNLFFLNFNKWKPLRQKLTPVFTSGKLKEMFYLVNGCGEHFEHYLDKLGKSSRKFMS